MCLCSLLRWDEVLLLAVCGYLALQLLLIAIRHIAQICFVNVLLIISFLPSRNLLLWHYQLLLLLVIFHRILTRIPSIPHWIINSSWRSLTWMWTVLYSVVVSFLGNNVWLKLGWRSPSMHPLPSSRLTFSLSINRHLLSVISFEKIHLCVWTNVLIFEVNHSVNWLLNILLIAHVHLSIYFISIRYKVWVTAPHFISPFSSRLANFLMIIIFNAGPRLTSLFLDIWILSCGSLRSGDLLLVDIHVHFPTVLIRIIRKLNRIINIVIQLRIWFSYFASSVALLSFLALWRHWTLLLFLLLHTTLHKFCLRLCMWLQPRHARTTIVLSRPLIILSSHNNITPWNYIHCRLCTLSNLLGFVFDFALRNILNLRIPHLTFSFIPIRSCDLFKSLNLASHATFDKSQLLNFKLTGGFHC